MSTKVEEVKPKSDQAMADPSAEEQGAVALDDASGPRSSGRSKGQTEKGRLYEISVRSKELDAFARKMKRSFRHVEAFMSEALDVERIRSARDNLMQEYDEFEMKYEHLVALAGDELSEALVQRFEAIEESGELLFKSINQRVMKLIDENRLLEMKDAKLHGGLRDQSDVDQGSPLPETKPFCGSESLITNELLSNLCNQLSLARLPPPEPDVFTGNVLQYQSWRRSFETLISSHDVPENERLYYLSRYLGGEAKECVECYLFMDSGSAYELALRDLDKRFGNSFVIGERMRDKIDSFPKIHGKDAQGLRRFADYLHQCESCMASVPGLQFLNDPRENRRLLLKLPDWLVQRWRRKVSEFQSEHDNFPSFSVFVRFIVKEAEIANEPHTCLNREDSSRLDASRLKSSNVSGKKSTSHAVGSKDLVSDSKASCVCCSKSHPLIKCGEFAKFSVADKNTFIMAKKLCRGCLVAGHVNKKCRNRAKCTVCQRNHPTCLHECVIAYRNEQKRLQGASTMKVDAQEFVPQSQSTVQSQFIGDSGFPESGCVTAQSLSSATSSKSKCLSSMIVPVFLSHSSQPNKERLVYAMLDTQSDTSFVLESTRQAMGVDGTDVSLSLSTMFAENKDVQCKRVSGFTVRAYDSSKKIQLPSLYSRPIMPCNRSHIPTAEMADRWPHLSKIKSKLMPVSETAEIGLLIGYNCSKALIPREVVAVQSGPFAQRTDLGWGIVGLVDCNSSSGHGFSHRIVAYEVSESKVNQVTFRTSAKELVTPREVLQVLEADFKDVSQGVGLSCEDKRFIHLMKSNISMDENHHYVMPLPFKREFPPLQNNRIVAEKRLLQLRRKLERDPAYKSKYVAFISEIIENGYASKVSDSDVQKAIWFLPHHGVINSRDKLRVVFDCSAKFMGSSLNDCLLQGPDLTNSLLGVLLRFRQDTIAFSCDIIKMYYQFRVIKGDRFYMCFLWWPFGDLSREPCVYAMDVHTFGLRSSPSCSNFGLRQVADDFELEFGSDASNFLRKNFYVDDGLKSVSNPDEAVRLICKTSEMCSRASLTLHKFVSNSAKVLESVSPEKRLASEHLDLRFDTLPIERALGVQWHVQSDTFQFQVASKGRPMTRRGLLSTVAGLYDPLGFLAPFTLRGKQILQQLCIAGVDWDEPVPLVIRSSCTEWLESFPELERVSVPRCLLAENCIRSEIQLHHFCDASSSGYGCCSYLRVVDVEGKVHVSFVMAKSRVAPVRPITIPRLELTAAVLAVKVANVIESELEFKMRHFFWTDSRVVLGYIKNMARRFHVFVANRVGLIHSHTNVDQWHHVSGDLNVADLASRGCLPGELCSSRWFYGPEFLSHPDLPLVCGKVPDCSVSDTDPEVKSVKILATKASIVFNLDRFAHISTWRRLKKIVALILCLVNALKAKKFSSVTTRSSISVYDSVGVTALHAAEQVLLKVTQRSFFPDELKALSQSKPVKLASPLSKLDCFIANDVIKVGGRLVMSQLCEPVVHPIVVPKGSHVARLLVDHFHKRVLHQGKVLTLNEIRSNGFWILGVRELVARHIFHCITCRKLRAAPLYQKMANLPVDRIQPEPAFTYCGVDLFGPFCIREGRKELKRWGCIFTCLASRAVHLEVVNSLSTSSFINALRRFIALRGPITLLRCDQGTNFVGAEREFIKALSHMSNPSVKAFLEENNCVFEFKTNPPTASHMSGVWERLIRSVRSILNTLMFQHGEQLDDDSLRTFLTEVSAVLNSRPLSLDPLSDPNYLEPLTPNHLLTAKSKIVVSPPGEFQKEDVYSIKRWRRVQYLVNQFWSRWKCEYVHSLQSRSKWTRPQRNLEIGDVVVLKDDSVPRNAWSLARVRSVNLSADGKVRSANIVVGSSELDRKGCREKELVCLERPVNKLVLLVENVNSE